MEFTPPDGGYGWIVAISSCIMRIFTNGFFKSFGFVQIQIHSAFPEASSYEISWISAMLGLVGQLTSPITGALCRSYGCRLVGIIGGIICSIAFLSSMFASTISMFIFTIGFVLSVGIGMAGFPGLVLTSQYFDKKRGKAVSLCVAGNAVGGFILPPLITHLFQKYALRGGLLILSGIMMHICVGGMLLRPPSVHAIIMSKSKKKKANVLLEDIEKAKMVHANIKLDNRCQSMIAISESNYDKVLDITCGELILSRGNTDKKSGGVKDIKLTATISNGTQNILDKSKNKLLNGIHKNNETQSLPNISVNNGKVETITVSSDDMTEKSNPSKLTKIFRMFVDPKIMLTYKFILVCLSVILFSTTTPFAMIYLPVYTHSIGLDTSLVAYLLAASSLADIFARFGIGYLADMKLMTLTTQFIFCNVISLTGIFIIPWVSDYIAIGIAASIHCFGVGSWFVSLPLILADHHGSESLSITFGFIKMVQGIVCFVSPQICGLIIDLTGEVRNIYFYMAIANSMAIIFLLIVQVLDRRREK